MARYQRIRRPRHATGKPRRVYVLSRITLGADMAVTSVLLAAAKRRFPRAEIVFVGPRKNYELFAGDPRIRHAPVAYPRGSLADRLSVWDELKALLSGDDSLVIDPDSRLTQLGLLAVCPEERYHFFESRAYGADTDRLAAGAGGGLGRRKLRRERAPSRTWRWGPAYTRGRHIAVSLGVGENQAKRLPDPFEEELLRLLAGLGLPLCDRPGRRRRRGGTRAARGGTFRRRRPACGRDRSPGSPPSSPAAACMSATIPPASTWPRRRACRW